MGGADIPVGKVLGRVGGTSSQAGNNGGSQGFLQRKNGGNDACSRSVLRTPPAGGSHRGKLSRMSSKHPDHWRSEPNSREGDSRSTRSLIRDRSHGASLLSQGSANAEVKAGDSRLSVPPTTASYTTNHITENSAETRRRSLKGRGQYSSDGSVGGTRCFPRFRVMMCLCCVKGGVGSKLTPIEADLIDEDVQDLVEDLQVSENDMSKLRKIFKKLKTRATGTVDCNKILTHVKMTRTPFTDHVFNMAGIDPEGAMTFFGLCRVLMTYCVFSKDDILHFLFQQYDTDGSGAIDEHEFRELVKAVNDASPMFPGNFAKALQEFDANSDGMIDFSEFRALEKAFPLVCFPAFRLQDSLQEQFLGRDFWLKTREGLVRRQIVTGNTRSKLERYRTEGVLQQPGTPSHNP